MAEFSTLVPDNRFNEFVMHTVERTGSNLHNVVTPDHPLLRFLEKTGGIGRETPGRATVENIRYATQKHITTLTQQSGLKSRSLSEDKSITRAHFPIHMLVQDFMIDYWTYEMATSSVDMMGVVQQRLQGLDEGLDEEVVDRVWNGYTEDGVRQWGIKDMIRFDVSSDPDHGPLGGIGIADIPTWVNQSYNYDAPVIQWNSAGAITQEILSGDNGWLETYIACSLRSKESKAQSQPNLIAVNGVMYRRLMQLQRNQLVVRDELGSKELGVDGFRFQNALVYHDPDVPDDPNNSDYGVAFMMNTRIMKLCFIKGIEKKWRAMHQMDTETGYQKDRITAMTTKVANPRLQGVCYGGKAAAVV